MSAESQVLEQGGHTAWGRNLAAPVRDFLSNETGGAAVMLAGAVVALIWANVAPTAYEQTWTTVLGVHLGDAGISMDLRHWINEGLMTLFFLVVGLEAKRELDVGELRERRRVLGPALAAAGGLVVPVVIYLLINGGGSGAHGWGTAMSTDTAFALGILALLTPRAATRMRVFLLTLSVFDDLGALVVIAIAYSGSISVVALAIAAALFIALLLLRYLPAGRTAASVLLATALWVAMYKSGVDPVVSGLLIGLVTGAYPPSRNDLERASSLAEAFREQPTADLARSVQRGVTAAISPNERLQYQLHPIVSYAVLPLFAVANAGVHITGPTVSSALSSPIFIGIVVGYIVGKPIGVLAGSWLGSRRFLHGARPLISGPTLTAVGTCAGVGFTVSLLIASLAFSGQHLSDAKLGILATLVLAPITTAIVMAVIRRLPAPVRARQIARSAGDIPDLVDDVEPERDHIRGDNDAPVTLLEYGDFECSYCGQAEPVIRELMERQGSDVRYVWRHLPLNDVHPYAQLAAEAAEAAGAQGHFWEMYDALLAHQDALKPRDLSEYATELGLDVERFREDLRRHEYAGRVLADVATADESGVSGTPTFFVNGKRHYGVYDVDALTTAVAAAKRRALLPAVAGS